MWIQTSSSELNFGWIFVNSVSSLYFHIKNDLWTSISVALIFDEISDLALTSKQ